MHRILPGSTTRTAQELRGSRFWTPQQATSSPRRLTALPAALPAATRGALVAIVEELQLDQDVRKFLGRPVNLEKYKAPTAPGSVLALSVLSMLLLEAFWVDAFRIESVESWRVSGLRGF